MFSILSNSKYIALGGLFIIFTIGNTTHIPNTYLYKKQWFMNLIRIIIVALMIPVYVVAQPTAYGNFKTVEQEIVFQKVVSLDSITPAKLEAYYKTLPYVSNLEATAEGLQFSLNDVAVDYKKFGFVQVNTHILLQTGKFNGKVSIGVKDGRYRISITNIQFTGNLGYKIVKENENLTPYATKNSATQLSSDWCKPNLLGLLDKAFTDKLEFKEEKEEW
jgi:hypothetical protein